MEHLVRPNEEDATELEWLKYFYVAVRPALGPADGDIIQWIKECFQKQQGKNLPIGYELWSYEEEEDD